MAPLETWYLTVKVTADPETFRGGGAGPLEQRLQDEVVSNLHDCVSLAAVVTVRRQTDRAATT